MHAYARPSVSTRTAVTSPYTCRPQTLDIKFYPRQATFQLLCPHVHVPAPHDTAPYCALAQASHEAVKPHICRTHKKHTQVLGPAAKSTYAIGGTQTWN
eukprot:365811-Chlamydomonas_euryale.AAC.9